MKKRSVTHATFVIERTYAASPARVFAAWSRKDAKARWFACHDEWKPSLHELDFRVGGRERLHTGPRGGTVHAFDSLYQDIVPDQRIVYTYDMHLDDVRISVSLATVELIPEGTGTRLVFTEQGAFLDGHTTVEEREEGTRVGLDNLDRALRHAAASA
ncbi:SRPBCC family protein [Pyxidicoccus xibeiensis]|uniref:SRPBCC family protein n=1 Tax=Pyxidicoccus xibeiensis TaxID=2906759 RepID=UPI0020A7424A|nr:SRPBCC domain-containing protein [Pyxidicoccus xibeiensis]MCP3141861.1 SRPBCC family protein [Pyxidicoccus xibeiensis]